MMETDTYDHHVGICPCCKGELDLCFVCGYCLRYCCSVACERAEYEGEVS
jgi:hypothetical protein